LNENRTYLYISKLVLIFPNMFMLKLEKRDKQKRNQIIGLEKFVYMYINYKVIIINVLSLVYTLSKFLIENIKYFYQNSNTESLSIIL